MIIEPRLNPQDGCSQKKPTRPTQLVEHDVEVFLESVRGDVQLVHDRRNRTSLEHQRNNPTLGERETMSGQDKRAHGGRVGCVEDHRNLAPRGPCERRRLHDDPAPLMRCARKI